MEYEIKIHEEALSDIQNAIDWYNNQSKGLGGRFLKQIKSQVDLLKKKMQPYIPIAMRMYTV